MLRKGLATLAVAGVMVVAASSGAYAARTGSFSLKTTGVTFASGTFEFLNNGYDPEDFKYAGNLKDTAADGNAVFVHGKVDSYPYEAKLYNSGGNGTTLYKSQFLDAWGETRVATARVQACQDRGTLISDLCSDKLITQ